MGFLEGILVPLVFQAASKGALPKLAKARTTVKR